MDTIGYFDGQRVVDADQLLARARLLVPGVRLRLLVVELARGGVERERDVGARLVARRFDRPDDALDGFFDRADARSEAAFVADRRGEAVFLQVRLERVEHLDAGAQRFGEVRRRRAARP